MWLKHSAAWLRFFTKLVEWTFFIIFNLWGQKKIKYFEIFSPFFDHPRFRFCTARLQFWYLGHRTPEFCRNLKKRKKTDHFLAIFTFLAIFYAFQMSAYIICDPYVQISFLKIQSIRTVELEFDKIGSVPRFEIYPFHGLKFIITNKDIQLVKRLWTFTIFIGISKKFLICTEKNEIFWGRKIEYFLNFSFRHSSDCYKCFAFAPTRHSYDFL